MPDHDRATAPLHLARWTVSSGSNARSRGAVIIDSGGHHWQASAEGNGAIDALYRAVDKAIAEVLDGHPRLLGFDIHALGEGTDTIGVVNVRIAPPLASGERGGRVRRRGARPQRHRRVDRGLPSRTQQDARRGAEDGAPGGRGRGRAAGAAGRRGGAGGARGRRAEGDEGKGETDTGDGHHQQAGGAPARPAAPGAAPARCCFPLVSARSVGDSPRGRPLLERTVRQPSLFGKCWRSS